MASDYIFELANSIDLTKIDQIKHGSNKNLDLTLNAGGSFTITLALEDPLSLYVEEITTCILIKKRNTGGTLDIVWSGPVWSIEENTPNTVTISAVGWLQLLARRFIKTDLIYAGLDAGSIAMDILNKSNAAALALGAPTYIKAGTIQATASRTRTYKAFETVLNIIKELSTIENGYDFSIDPSSRSLNIYSQIGSESSAYFEYGVHVESISRTSDAEKITNLFYAFGANNTTQSASDPESQMTYGLLEESASLSDMSDELILAAYANAEIAIKKSPIRIFSFSPKSSNSNTNIPRIFEDYNLGDTVYLTVNKGRLQALRQPVRVFGASIAWDDNGNEQVANIQGTSS